MPAEKIDVQDFADRSEWKRPPKVSFGQHASLSIARWVLWIFAGVLALAFVGLGVMLFRGDNPMFDKAAELLKFLVQSVVPLVTLAVGYYLGDRRSHEAVRE